MTMFHGYELFEEGLNERDPRVITVNRQIDRLENPVGQPLTLDARSPRVSTEVTINFYDRTSLFVFVNTWVPARFGMKVPVWVPTWNRDFAVLAALGGGVRAYDDGNLTIHNRGNSRRFAYSFGVSGSTYGVKQAAGLTMVAGPDPNTVDLGFVNAVGSGIDWGSSFSQNWLTVGRLYLMRLANGEVSIDWYGGDMAEATIQFLEVPEPEYPNP